MSYIEMKATTPLINSPPSSSNPDLPQTQIVEERTLLRDLFRPVVIVGALGYFVDIYDMTLFVNVREASLKDIGLGDLIKNGDWYHDLLSWQMLGMMFGGVVFGIFGDRMGRLTTLFGSIFIYSIANIGNSFVDNFWPYAIWRFIAGFGLAGELGGSIALVSETLSKERRGYGTALVTTIGLFGAVFGGVMAELVSWRTNYQIGGGLGLVLLLMRIGVQESGMYQAAIIADSQENSISRGNFFALFTDRKRFIKYLKCVMIGLPSWYIIGILVQRSSSHFAPAFNIQGPILANRSVTYSYLGASLGDLLSGLLS